MSEFIGPLAPVERQGSELRRADSKVFHAVDTAEVALSECDYWVCTKCELFNRYSQPPQAGCPYGTTCADVIWVTRETYLTYRLTGTLP